MNTKTPEENAAICQDISSRAQELAALLTEIDDLSNAERMTKMAEIMAAEAIRYSEME